MPDCQLLDYCENFPQVLLGSYEVNGPVIGCSLLTQLMISVDISLHSTLNVCTFHNSFPKRYGLLAWITSKCTCCPYKGHICVQRGKTTFSLIGLEQSQNQNVKHIKEDGGNRGLYGYQEEKELMEISRPEVMRVLREEISYNADDDKVKEHSETAQYNNGSLEI